MAFTTTDNYPTSVKQAARLLDQAKPGWEYKIDLEKLEMGSCTYCILGQLYGDCDIGFKSLFDSDWFYVGSTDKSCLKAVPFGTDTYVEEWVAEIKERRSLAEDAVV